MPKAATRVLNCSFCGKVESEVEKIIAGPGVYICDECVALCDLLISGQPIPTFQSLEKKSVDELLADMVRLAASREQVEEVVRDRARRLRDRKVTWARIGESLEISRQSAWERFSGEE